MHHRRQCFLAGLRVKQEQQNGITSVMAVLVGIKCKVGGQCKRSQEPKGVIDTKTKYEPKQVNKPQPKPNAGEVSILFQSNRPLNSQDTCKHCNCFSASANRCLSAKMLWAETTRIKAQSHSKDKTCCSAGLCHCEPNMTVLGPASLQQYWAGSSRPKKRGLGGRCTREELHQQLGGVHLG